MYYINNDLTTNERYDLAKFLEFSIDSFSMLDSYFCSQIKLIPYSGALTITNQVGRPDLLSYDIYGDTQYWWVLLLYNNITDPAELTAGLTLSYPSLQSLENLYFTLSTKQKAKDTSEL